MVVDEVTQRTEPAPPGPVTHLDEDESKAKGKTARSKAPRASQAVFEPAPGRPDPVSLLESQAKSGCPSWCPSAMGACSSRPSPSTAGRR